MILSLRTIFTFLATASLFAGCTTQEQAVCGEPATDSGSDASQEEDEARKVVIEAPAMANIDLDRSVETRYEPKYLDPLLEKIRKREDDRKAAVAKETSAKEARQKKEEEAKKKKALSYVSSLPDDQRPTTLGQFKILPHLPPVPQHYAGTCWSFAGTSLLESEVIRITGKKIKLSEIHTVYHEYLAKAARFLAERGESAFGEGSETNAVTRMWKEHGAVPKPVYDGVTNEDGLHDHIRMFTEMEDILHHARDKTMWDEATVLGMFRVILDRNLGAPMTEFEFDDVKYTPQSFLADVLKVNPDDYVSIMSTLREPFWKKGEFEVQDNWWHSKEYYNVPLDDFYGSIKTALDRGYTLTIGGDVSEPGKDGINDVLFIPPYDIPSKYIDQLAREYRIVNRSTGDDHGIHLVGHAELGGHDWFLIKDSGRSSRRGKHKGYYFMRGDFVRLKMLTISVHRDAVSELLTKFE
jgi:bleomycin hydrolase